MRVIDWLFGKRRTDPRSRVTPAEVSDSIEQLYPTSPPPEVPVPAEPKPTTQPPAISNTDPFVEAVRRGNVEEIKTLVAHGADVNSIVGYERNTVLKEAALEGHFSVAEYLLSCGANANARNRFGLSALFTAAWFGHADIVQLLLAHGADVNIRDSDGRTALFKATAEGHTEVVRMLLAAGVDLHARHRDGSTVLDVAHRTGHREITQLLEAAWATARKNPAGGIGSTAGGHA